MKKVFNYCLMFTSLVSLCACSKETILKKPDYSKYNDSFDFYAYAAANDGTYTYDGVTSTVCNSLLTKEQFEMYKDAGLNVFFPQSKAIIREEIETIPEARPESWEKAKKVVDTAREAGLDRTILYDQGLSWLGLEPNNKSLVGEDTEEVKYKFQSYDELDDYVYELVSLYADYPGVYGVIMADEPKAQWTTSYAQVYNSLKRVNKRLQNPLYIQYNLNPLIWSKKVFDEYYPYVEGTDEYNYKNLFIRYKKYIKNFLDAMEPDYVQYDSYPMKSESAGINDLYLPCLQYVAGEAKERNIKFHNVTQTFSMINSGSLAYRAVGDADCRWMNNILLGFGVDQISYFTYFTHDGGTSAGETFVDGASFVDIFGNKTDLYDVMKKIIAEDQDFAHVYKRFEYVASDVVKNLPLNFKAPHLTYFEKDGTFTALKEYSVNKEAAFISELYDKENDFYMYTAMNVVDPASKGSKAYEHITLKFDSQYKYALVYRDAKPLYYKLNDNHELVVKAAPGEASFVIPFF